MLIAHVIEKIITMRNVLIFAGIAGLAAAIAIYFFGEETFYDDDDYISDVDIENYDLVENTGAPIATGTGYNAM